MSGVQISPSLLAADASKLGEEIEAVTEAGADRLHLDIMDGHFVPNLSYGPHVLKSIRPLTTLPIDVHLMISPVEEMIPAFAEAGADCITVHPEATPHVHRCLDLIKSLGKKAGVALNPATPLETIQQVLPLVDLILIMTVNPGFGGQGFISDMLPKIKEARALINSLDKPIDLEVDGGIDLKTAPEAKQAGANILVAGTAIFKAESSYTQIIKDLKHSL